MKITIAEGGPAYNVGSMALIENAIKLARSKYQDCDITVMCFDPESVKNALIKDGLNNNILVLGELFYKPKQNKLLQTIWLVKTFLWFVYSRFLLLFTKRISWAYFGHDKRLLREIEQSDYVYCIGAERINDIYYKSALLALYCVGTYIKMGRKVVHLSLTIGPVFHKSTIYVAKNVLNKSYAIFVRDAKSYEILEEWNCTVPIKFCSYDIAILQNHDDAIAKRLLEEFCLGEGFIAVSAVKWAFRKAKGPSRMPEYNRAHAVALDYIIEKYDRDVVFIHTVYGGMFGKGDANETNTIISLMKNKGRVKSIERLLTPVEMASLLSKSYFGIVTRMHAAILCSGAGCKPIISINYLYKLREYMKNLRFENYSVDIDYVNENDLISFIDNMFIDYDINIKRLNQRMGEMQKTLLTQMANL